MTAIYTFDVFSSLDGFGAASGNCFISRGNLPLAFAAAHWMAAGLAKLSPVHSTPGNSILRLFRSIQPRRSRGHGDA